MLVLALVFLIAISVCTSYESYRYALANDRSGQLYVSDEIYYVDSARRYLEFIFGVDVNASMYSNKTNADYFNLEHPPLGKYLIALSMVIYGDNPLGWRMPGIIESGLIVLFVGGAILLAGKNRIAGALASIAGVAALGSEKLLAVSGSIAMLDIHLAFFTSLTVSFLLLGKRRPALIAGSLALSTKLSGAASIVAVMLYDLYREGSVRDKAKRLSEDVLIPFMLYVALMIPLIAYFGPVDIVKETLSALKWHVTSRPPGPPTSTPLGWILNSNPFYYSFKPAAQAATLNTVLHITALVVMAPLVYIATKCRSDQLLVGPLNYLSVLIIYALVWILGNRTLYSFYSVQLIPPMAATIGSLVIIGGMMRCQRYN